MNQRKTMHHALCKISLAFIGCSMAEAYDVPASPGGFTASARDVAVDLKWAPFLGAITRKMYPVQILPRERVGRK
jgi:hypothetical protein